jgi:hypothetical protein
MSGGETSEGAGDVVDALLALPPKEFTKARNDAVKRLRAEGRGDAAEAVRGLARPPMSLWALNRLAREDAAPIDAFLDAARKLLDAHRHGGDIRAATPPERDAEARVVSAASELVRSQGARTTDAVTSRMRETLRAAAADAEVAAALREGRLTHEPAAPSLDEILASLPRTGAARATAAARPSRPAEDKRRALREELDGARKQASGARAEARGAADEAAESRRELQRAEAAAQRKQREAEAADERVRSLEERLASL